MSHIKIELRKEDVDFIKGVCDSFNKDPQELINVLHACQEHFGYLPAEVQEVVSEGLDVPVAKDIWCGDFLLILYNDPEREKSYKHMPWNSMLCKGCRKGA